MTRRLVLLPSVTALSVFALLLTGGCSKGGGGGSITKEQEDLMRRPAGSVPMPPEAAQAMQKANQQAGQKATQPAPPGPP